VLGDEFAAETEQYHFWVFFPLPGQLVLLIKGAIWEWGAVYISAGPKSLLGAPYL
jgi:hypothetical protein